MLDGRRAGDLEADQAAATFAVLRTRSPRPRRGTLEAQ
jgi:hypothetical protein